MSGSVGLDGSAHRLGMLVVNLEPCVAEFFGKRLDCACVQRDACRVPGARIDLVLGSDEQNAMSLGIRSCHRTNCAVELVAEHPNGLGLRHCADATLVDVVFGSEGCSTYDTN